jgi:hypothetical protein
MHPLTRAAAARARRSTERGLRPAAGGRAAVEAAVDVLAELAAEDAAAGRPPTDASRLSATWRLLWTTERETLFLLEKGLFRVGPAGESYQARACALTAAAPVALPRGAAHAAAPRRR